MVILTEEKITSLKALLEAASRVVVLGHTHADGDALGSTAALCLFLKESLGKEVSCLFSDTPPDNLKFLLAAGVPYYFHDRQPLEAVQAIEKADLIVLLDANAFNRTEALTRPLQESSARKVLIDHHLNPDAPSFDLVFSTPDISSASELLYWILKELGYPVKPGMAEASPADKAIGEALLAGMTTDTNNFNNSVFPSTFRMASELIEAGVDRDALLQQIYWCYRENRVRLMGYMQSQQLTILPCGAAYMILSKKIQAKFDLREGESEGLVNVPLTIENVRLSVLVKEDGPVWRVSIRSKKGTSAQQLAMTVFHGGGHENAAGGKIIPGEDYARSRSVRAYLERVLNDYLS
jgi:phosphoesterase RecJ-like protein